MFQPTRFKLGRVKGVRHPGLPRMAAFLRSVSLPALPASQDWLSSIAEWPMLKNDEVSNCTIATVGHMTEQESIYADVPAAIMSDDEALAGYTTLNPAYDPSKPETDTGLYEGDVGQYWLKNGFKVGGSIDKIAGFADCNVKNLDELKYSILLTGNAFLGVQLPRCAENDELWDVPTNRDEAELIGGHAIPAVGWDANYLYVVTWGKLVPATWPFVEQYLDEVHVTLTRRWMNSKSTTPAGVSWDNLVAATRQFSVAA